MKKLISALAATCALAVLAPADALAGPQQERMKRCSQEAREQALKGDARRQFMSTCLRGKHEQAGAGEVPASAAAGGKAAKAGAGGQADSDAPSGRAGAAKRKACNQAATEQSLSGAKRKTFIAECLSA
ncbi:PsiF family protein [Thauera sinica]|uniref:PsiF family protein n=1 Tax=Thauera sinica TaxID=2665146 RepID=A0ABW1ASU6_9RHOO|nr:PsiF family protein [Thauera sp. K11]ATE61412.1 PsiF repeat-containing protein [Thauera sp. K11]